jgi:hypothetical protein
MNGQYPNLSWALINNPYLETTIFEEYKNKPRYLSYIENLISELVYYKCEGIQEKVKNVDVLNKFTPILSELEFAWIIAKNRGVKELKLLPDDYLSGKSPDILCRDEIFTSYIEVTRIDENPYIVDTILNYLRKILKSYHYRVDVFLKTELSIPVMKHDDRHIQKSLVEKSLEIFYGSFKEKISNDIFQSPSFRIDTNGLTFTVEKTYSGMGYPGLITWDCIEIPTEILCNYIKGRLIKKAIKRNSFEKEHREACYIIALDFQESSIDATDISRLLYGRTNQLLSNAFGLPEADYTKWKSDMWDSINNKTRNNASWTLIEQAKSMGWETLLIEKSLIPKDYSYVDEEGIFISEKEMKNVSGVLFRDKWNNVAFYPNPFCDIEINDPKLLNFI